MTTWLVAYDVSDDDVRDHIARHLEARGTRVQESVFECGVDSDGAQRLAGELQRLLGAPDNGNVRMYRVCDACLAVSLLVGSPGEDSRQACLIV